MTQSEPAALLRKQIHDLRILFPPPLISSLLFTVAFQSSLCRLGKHTKMAAVAVIPPELWSEFDSELQSLIEGNQAAERSYTAGKGISLASMAVGSVVMRLTKVTLHIKTVPTQRASGTIVD